MDEQVLTLFNIDKLNESLELLKQKTIKLSIEQYIKDFDDINDIIIAYNEIKNSIIGLDKIQKFIIKNRSNISFGLIKCSMLTPVC